MTKPVDHAFVTHSDQQNACAPPQATIPLQPCDEESSLRVDFEHSESASAQLLLRNHRKIPRFAIDHASTLRLNHISAGYFRVTTRSTITLCSDPRLAAARPATRTGSQFDQRPAALSEERLQPSLRRHLLDTQDCIFSWTAHVARLTAPESASSRRRRL